MKVNEQLLRSTVNLVWFSLLLGAVADRTRAQTTQPTSGTVSAQTLLHIARSKDGLTFTDTGEVFLQNATARFDNVRQALSSLERSVQGTSSNSPALLQLVTTPAARAGS